MNKTDAEAKKKCCPLTGKNCLGSQCMLWEWDEDLFEGADSYISEPGPTGHCGLTRGER